MVYAVTFLVLGGNMAKNGRSSFFVEKLKHILFEVFVALSRYKQYFSYAILSTNPSFQLSVMIPQFQVRKYSIWGRFVQKP